MKTTHNDSHNKNNKVIYAKVTDTARGVVTPGINRSTTAIGVSKNTRKPNSILRPAFFFAILAIGAKKRHTKKYNIAEQTRTIKNFPTMRLKIR